MTRLVVVFDVSGLTNEQVAGLAGEAIVQGEASELHPTAPLVSAIVVRQPKAATILEDALRAVGDPT